MTKEPILLYAQPVIESEEARLTKECEMLKTQGITPLLKVILVGDNPASVIYTKNKKRFAEKIGARCEIERIDSNVSKKDFLEIVSKANNDRETHGILIQLPLPETLSEIDTTDLVNPLKDVDGFHYENVAKLYRGQTGEHTLIPCTPKGLVTLANHYGISFESKKVLVIGRSLIVGKPMSLLISNLNATVTLAHSKSINLQELTRDADIIITAVGQPKKFTKEFFRNDQSQIVFDVGMNKSKEGKLCGDCDFENIKSMVRAITPVPKGIGPMTIFSVSQNLISATKNIEGK